MNAHYINNMAMKIYAQNLEVGWWDDPDRCLYTCLQLVSTEVAEGTEGERKKLMDDHLPHRPMGEVEIADGLVRTLDLGGHMGLEYDAGNQTAPIYGKEPAQLHLWINRNIIGLADCMFFKFHEHRLNVAYSYLVSAFIHSGMYLGYDIHGAMEEKLEYNRHRADHKRENRAADGGKAF